MCSRSAKKFPNFLTVFIRMLENSRPTLEMKAGVTAGNYLYGFLLDTRDALCENGRESMPLFLTVPHRVSIFGLSVFDCPVRRCRWVLHHSHLTSMPTINQARRPAQRGQLPFWPCREKC